MNKTYKAEALAAFDNYCRNSSYEPGYNGLMQYENVIRQALSEQSTSDQEWPDVMIYKNSLGELNVDCEPFNSSSVKYRRLVQGEK